MKIAGWNREEKNLVGAAVFAVNWLHILRRIASFFFLSLILHLQTQNGDGFFLYEVLGSLWKKNSVLYSRAKS